MRSLVLTGGIRHPFDENTAVVVDLLSETGIRSEVTTDIELGIRRLTTEPFDLVTVMALRWRMLGDPKYAPYRNRYGFSMSADNRRILADFVNRGGGLLGLHTACLCFDDWPEWRDLLGCAWDWNRSYHPPLGPVSAMPTPSKHVLTAGLPAFEVIDEVYSALDTASDVQPLLTARSRSQSGDEPVLWARRVGRGRVAFDALGHDARSLGHAVHRRIIMRCGSWVAGLPDGTIASI